MGWKEFLKNNLQLVPRTDDEDEYMDNIRKQATHTFLNTREYEAFKQARLKQLQEDGKVERKLK